MSYSDITAITEVMRAYFTGLYHADSDQLRKVFHPKLAYVCATEGDELYLDLETYMGNVDQRVPPASRGDARHEEILDISLANSRLAHVRARATLMGRTYHDELTLIRQDGAWRIVTKVFTYIQNED